MAGDAGEKSFDPTPHRRQQAREQGQLARSQDLNSAVLLLAGLLALLFLGANLATALAQLTRDHLGGEPWLELDLATFAQKWHLTLGEVGKVVLPIMGVALASAVLINLAQVGILFLPEKAAPDFKHVNPIAGLQRMFSLATVMRLVFGMLKIGLIAAVAIVSLYDEREQLLALGGLTTPQLALYLCELLLWTALKIALALFLLALFDYGYHWWQNEQQLRMTQQEVREEMRNFEGDPHIAARRKAAHRALVKNQLRSKVPTADVVVTNPTELAVAIKYDPRTMAAPIVVAKGADRLAQEIRQIALEFGIPVLERKPLARALYRDVEIDRAIPADLYAAVAEVLAYVYRLKGKKPPERTAG